METIRKLVIGVSPASSAIKHATITYAGELAIVVDIQISACDGISFRKDGLRTIETSSLESIQKDGFLEEGADLFIRTNRIDNVVYLLLRYPDEIEKYSDISGKAREPLEGDSLCDHSIYVPVICAEKRSRLLVQQDGGDYRVSGRCARCILAGFPNWRQ